MINMAGRYSFTYPNITAVLATLCMLHKQMESIIKLLQLSVYFFNLFLQPFISLLQTLKAFPPEEKRTDRGDKRFFNLTDVCFRFYKGVTFAPKVTSIAWMFKSLGITGTYERTLANIVPVFNKTIWSEVLNDEWKSTPWRHLQAVIY